MNNWWKKTRLIFSIIIVALTTRSFKAIAEISNISKIKATEQLFTHVRAANPEVYRSSWSVALNDEICQELRPDYQKVYGFETQNFYINICQLGSNYFYYRKSKTNAHDTVVISAQPVFGGDVFQAIDGKITYFVGIDDQGYYSSVTYNNNKIVFEPELQPPSTALQRNKLSLGNLNGKNINVNSTELEQTSATDLDNQENTNDQSKICTQDKADIHPYFKGWQEFIGESPQIVWNYATDNGHHFIYNSSTPSQALVETADGLIIDLNIAILSKKIERVCVDSVAEN